MTTLFSTEPLGSEEVISGGGSLPSLEAGTLASRFIVSQSAVKARFPALPEVVAQPFPGRLVLEKEMATYSNILTWEIPWTEEPGGQQSLGITKSGTRLSD